MSHCAELSPEQNACGQQRLARLKARAVARARNCQSCRWLRVVHGCREQAMPQPPLLLLFFRSAAGFGYRAKYVVQCSRQLMERQGGPETWLRSLKDASYEDAAAALCELPGVGPKVAACICLFSLDHLRSIPVDTHVWQLAVRHYAPELAGKSLTARVHKEVQRAFETRFGDKCGWAHNVLFVSEVPAFRQRLPEELRPPPTPKKSKGGKKKRGDKDGIGEEARDVGGESVNELDGRETGENAVDLGEKEEGGTVGEAVTGVKVRLPL